MPENSNSPSEDQENKFFRLIKRLFFVFLHSPVQCLFAIVLSWFLSLIYIFDQDDINLKFKAAAVVFLWIFWIFAKSILKFIAVIVFLGLGAYGYYYYTKLDKIQCEDSGGYWNAQTQKCEDKGNFWQQIKRWLDIPAS